MSHSPGNVAKLAATPPKPASAGRFISPAEGQSIVQRAKLWKGTPYGTGTYAGSNPVSKKGADCSGSVWKIYQEAGFSYGAYTSTAGFKSLVGTDQNFVPGKHFFKQVNVPQVGDIAWWNGHMAIYDPHAGKTVPEGLDGNIWSARRKGLDFGPTRQNWYDNYVDKETSKNYGTVQWYRYWKALK